MFVLGYIGRKLVLLNRVFLCRSEWWKAPQAKIIGLFTNLAVHDIKLAYTSDMEGTTPRGSQGKDEETKYKKT